MRDRLDSTGHSFQAYFKRATSPLVVLRLLMEKPMYGYELTQEMKQRSGGAFTISQEAAAVSFPARRANRLTTRERRGPCPGALS